MAATSIGAARIDLELDLTKFVANIETARAKSGALGKELGAGANEANSKVKSATASLERYAKLIGANADQAKLLRAAFAGVSTEKLQAAAVQMQAIRNESVRAGEIQAEALRRVTAEQDANAAAIKRGADAQATALAQQRRLEQMRSNAADAFGPQLRAQELNAKGLAVEEGVRNRLAALMATERGRRIAEAQAIGQSTAAFDRQTGAIKKTVNAVNEYGLTGKQQTAALRQVPAQLTDIFVSLQGGQNPMTVLIQQGGQLKDVFGGVKPAVGALVAEIAKLINPMTLVAGVGALVAASFANASSEQSAFAQSLAVTNGRAGLTIRQLQGIASAISNIDGVSTSSASDTVAKVVATGQFVGAQVLLVASAAEQMRVATGKAVEETVGEFVNLARDPVDAILKLNESQRFLTDETYQQIKALQEQGDMAGAQALALQAYADNVDGVTDSVRENIGYLQQFTKSVKGLLADISDAVMGIGRATTNADLVRQQQNNIEGLEKARERARSGSIFQGGVFGGMSEAAYTQAIARAQNKIKELTQFDNVVGTQEGQAIDSRVQRQIDAIEKGNASKERRQELEETQIRNLYAQSTAADKQVRMEAALAASRKRYQESLPKGAKGPSGASAANADASAQLAAIRAQFDGEQNAIANSTKLLQAQYSARLVSAEDYYAKQRALLQQGTDNEAASIQRQIDFLRARDVSGKDASNVTKQITELEMRLAKVRADGATSAAILGIQEKDLADKRKQALEDYQSSADRQVESVNKGVDAQILAIMYGEREAEKQRKLTEIYDQQTEALQRLARERDRKDITPEQFDERKAIEEDKADRAAAAVIRSYERIDAAQTDWLNGLRSGVNEWVTETGKVASQIEAITNKTLDGAAEATANWALGVKGTFKDLLIDIGKELVKFFAKQAVLKFVQMFLPNGLSGASAGVSSGSMPTVGPYAKGGVFPNATPSLSAYSNQVVSQPTYFQAYAKGGVMGEVPGKSEAIMPLEKGPDGRLGVTMYGQGGGGGINLTLITNIDSNGSDTSSKGDQEDGIKQFAEGMVNVAKQEIMKSTMPGGHLYRAGVRV